MLTFDELTEQLTEILKPYNATIESDILSHTLLRLADILVESNNIDNLYVFRKFESYEEDYIAVFVPYQNRETFVKYFNEKYGNDTVVVSNGNMLVSIQAMEKIIPDFKIKIEETLSDPNIRKIYSVSLAFAVNKNLHEKTLELLKQGAKLETKDLYDAFVQLSQNNSIDPSLVELLGVYSALPKDVSVATIKLILWIEGNYEIKKEDFLNKPDINFNGCSGLQSPMQIAARTGQAKVAELLIEKGVRERPVLFSFGVHESHFLRLNLLDIAQYKNKIKNNFAQGIYHRDIESECEIMLLFLNHPTQGYYDEIEEMSKGSHQKYKFLPFFAWAAMNNRADLLDTDGFAKLVFAFPEAAAESLKIATVFGSKDYVRDIIYPSTLGSIRMALSIASAAKNNDMLGYIIEMLKQREITLKDLSYEAGYQDNPLFWAIRCENEEAVSILLENGMDTNEHVAGSISGEDHLFLAIRIGNITIIELLIQHGANLENKTKHLKTPLHEATAHQKWNVAYMLVEKYKVNINALDDEKKSPLDCINDQQIKEKLILLSQQSKNSTLTLGFLTSRTNSTINNNSASSSPKMR